MGNQKTKNQNDFDDIPDIHEEPPQPVDVDNLINGRYLIMKKLGNGAFGEVFLVTNKEDGKEYALKIERKPRTSSQEELEKEYSLIKSCDHPNIVNTHDFFISEYDPSESSKERNIRYIYTCYVLDFCNFGSLEDLFTNERVDIDKKNAVIFFIRLLEGVKHIHKRGIVHRDLKPENLLLNIEESLATGGGLGSKTQRIKDGFSGKGQVNVKIADFGVSKNFIQSRARTVAGTLIYAAPELFSGSYNELVDIWSLGIIFLQVLSGKSTVEYLHSFQLLLRMLQASVGDKLFKGRTPSPSECVLLCVANSEVFLTYMQKVCGIEEKEYIDILQQMICDSTKRWSAEKLLEHPTVMKWRRMYFPRESIPSSPSSPSNERKKKRERPPSADQKRASYFKNLMGLITVDGSQEIDVTGIKKQVGKKPRVESLIQYIVTKKEDLQPTRLQQLKEHIFSNYNSEVEKKLFTAGIPSLIVKLNKEKFLYPQLSFLHLLFTRSQSIVYLAMLTSMALKEKFISGMSETIVVCLSKILRKKKNVDRAQELIQGLFGTIQTSKEDENRLIYARMLDKSMDILLICSQILAADIFQCIEPWANDGLLKLVTEGHHQSIKGSGGDDNMSSNLRKKGLKLAEILTPFLPSLTVTFVLNHLLDLSVLSRVPEEKRGEFPLVLDEVFKILDQNQKRRQIRGGSGVDNEKIAKYYELMKLAYKYVVDFSSQRKMCDSHFCCYKNIAPGGICPVKLYKCKTCFGYEEAVVCHNCAFKCHLGHNIAPARNKGECKCTKKKCKILRPQRILDLLTPSYSNPPSVECKFDERTKQGNIVIQSRILARDGKARSTEPICTFEGENKMMKPDSGKRAFTVGYFEIQILRTGPFSYGLKSYNTTFGGGPQTIITWNIQKGQIEVQKKDGEKRVLVNYSSGGSGSALDVFGCGITDDRTVFFTKNGDLLPPLSIPELDEKDMYFFAFIETRKEDMVVHAKFGKRPFSFSFQKMRNYNCSKLGYVFDGAVLPMSRMKNIQVIKEIRKEGLKMRRDSELGKNLVAICDHLLRVADPKGNLGRAGGKGGGRNREEEEEQGEEQGRRSSMIDVGDIGDELDDLDLPKEEEDEEENVDDFFDQFGGVGSFRFTGKM